MAQPQQSAGAEAKGPDMAGADRPERAEAGSPQPAAAEKPPLRVGMIGYAFMGAAHSQGWRTAGRVFDLPRTPVLAALCGRDAVAVRAAADRHGWASAETDWRALIARDDIDLVDICTPATATPRSPSPRWPRASTCCARSPSRTPSRRPRR